VGVLLFAGDICIFGYEHRDGCDFARGGLLCTAAEGDGTLKVVANIRIAFAKAYNLPNNPHTKTKLHP